MLAQWTGALVGEMHLKRVTAKQLAAEIGWNEKYLSQVMNGHREPKGAEEKLRAALSRLEEEQTRSSSRSDGDPADRPA